MAKKQKNMAENLENPKTPPFDDRQVENIIPQQKISASVRARNRSNTFPFGQKKLSTRTPSNYGEFTQQPEIQVLVSMTVPDQTLTIREIIANSQNGVPSNVGRVPIYRGEELFPDFERLDLSEKYDIIQEVKAEYKRRKHEALMKGKEQYEKKLRDDIIAELKKADDEKAAVQAQAAKPASTSTI